MFRDDFDETVRIGFNQQTLPSQFTFHENGVRVGFSIQCTGLDEKSSFLCCTSDTFAFQATEISQEGQNMRLVCLNSDGKKW